MNNELTHLDESTPLLLQIKTNLRNKLVPLVFYSCDEDNNTCSYFVWQSILKCTQHLLGLDGTTFWSLLNVKKTFIPKLVALLRHHANGNANSQNVDIVYSSLMPLIKKLNCTFANDEEKLVFYSDILSKLNDAISKEMPSKLRHNWCANRNKMIEAMFDCIGVAVEELISTSSESADESTSQFFKEIVTNYVSLLRC